MKTSSRIKIFFQQQIDMLLLSLSKPVESLSENDFHLIRVALKRIKSLLTLLEEIQINFKQKKYYTPFKVIFRLTGKIRDLQVQLLLIKSNPWNPTIDKFERELTRQTSEEKMKLLNLIQPGLILDVQKKVSSIMDYLDQLQGKKVGPFLIKKEKIIQKSLSAGILKPSHVHKLRKQIKDLYYLQKILMPKKKRLNNTDQFQELLGKWHDGRVLEQGLKTFMKSGILSREDIVTFESLERKISSANQQLYQAILHDKNDLLKRLA